MAAQLPAAKSQVEDLRAQQRILEDIFMHAAAHSRTCDSSSERAQRFLRQRDPELPDRIALDPRQVVEFSEGIGYLEMAIRDLCAKIAPAAVERARLLANINPDPDQQAIFDLEGERLDNFLRPIFAEAGIASDHLTEAELRAIHRWSDDSSDGRGRRSSDRKRLPPSAHGRAEGRPDSIR